MPDPRNKARISYLQSISFPTNSDALNLLHDTFSSISHRFQNKSHLAVTCPIALTTVKTIEIAVICRNRSHNIAWWFIKAPRKRYLFTKHTTAEATVRERKGAGRNALLAARGLGSPSQPVPPAILSKLCWPISVPKMTYGFEVVPTNDYMIEELDKTHTQNARIVQNLPSMTHTSSTHATIGWLTMRKMLFLWSILCLPDTNIYKIITVFMIKLHDKNDV